jgi:hypothetical protein
MSVPNDAIVFVDERVELRIGRPQGTMKIGTIELTDD